MRFAGGFEAGREAEVADGEGGVEEGEEAA